MLGVDETGMAALWQRNRRHGKWTAGTLPPTHLRDVGKVVEAAPEALTAVQIALLTIYDMCKAVDRGMQIDQVRLLEKAGGKSGHWKREANQQ